MKVSKNTTHNSIELDFEGAKPSEQLRTIIKAYGFWWFQKGKVWVHGLEGLEQSDVEFFNNFVEKRVKPLASAPAAVAPTVEAVTAAASTMSEEDKQKLLAALMK
jgi:hypothetical protein